MGLQGEQGGGDAGDRVNSCLHPPVSKNLETRVLGRRVTPSLTQRT